MFGVGKKSASARIDTIIGEHTHLQGDVHFGGGLHIDGKITGNVIADRADGAALTVSELGTIEGEVRVPNLLLNGTIVGDVHVGESAELASQARVTGNLYYTLIEMAIGAQVNGSLVYTGESSRRPEAVRQADTADAAPEPGPLQVAK
ncbi:MAG: polymer-forming cytoskeletal protein [Gammaproteobacteria bacterium]|jgi:cytoskeletal protein CcmA (bactofilin family)